MISRRDWLRTAVAAGAGAATLALVDNGGSVFGTAPGYGASEEVVSWRRSAASVMTSSGPPR